MKEKIICEICGENEATVHFTEIRGKKARKIHMCEECAAKKGIKIVKGQPPGINLENILSDLFSSIEEKPEYLPQLQCPNCGLTYQGFMSISKFSCSECYKAFESEIKPLLKRIHGNITHIGRVPKGVSKKESVPHKLRQLNIELKKAIEEERYEDAAKIRDEIRKMKEKKTV
ncbi:MAG: UvrB/UvrC motif-containing protein [Candidatus Hydrogenedentota bacterium]